MYQKGESGMALKIQFSAGDLEDEIGTRATQGREAVVAKRDLGRYYSVLRRSLPTFTIGEARVIAHAVAEASAPGPGRRGRDDEGGYHVVPAMLWAYVADMKESMERERAETTERYSRLSARLTPEGRAVLENGKRSRVDPFPHAEVNVDALVARLRVLTFAEAMAVVDAVERVAAEYSDEDGNFEFDPPYMGFSFTELVSVGLVPADDQTFDVIAYRYEPAIEPVWLDRERGAQGATARDVEWMERVEEIAAGPFRTEKDARAAATTLRTTEGDGPRRFVVRDTRDRYMLRTVEETAVG